MRTLAELEYDKAEDVWEGSHGSRRIRVAGHAFAVHLDHLARVTFGLRWEELGEEEYIAVLAEARCDLAFWSTRADDAREGSAAGI